MTFVSFLYFLFFLATVGPYFPVPDGPGFGSPLEFSGGADLGLLLGLITREPGFEVLFVVSGSGNLTPVSSSSEGSTSPSSPESLELELAEKKMMPKQREMFFLLLSLSRITDPVNRTKTAPFPKNMKDDRHSPTPPSKRQVPVNREFLVEVFLGVPWYFNKELP